MSTSTGDFEKLRKELEEAKAEIESLRKAQGGESAATPVTEEPKPTPVEGGMEVASIQEGDITLRRLVQRIAMILQAEMIVIMFYEQESGELIAIPPAYGVEDDKLQHFRIRATQGISGEVFREGRPLLFHDAANDERTEKDHVILMRVQNGLSVPLIIEKRDDENRIVDRTTIGVLHAFNKRKGEDFNDEDVRLLERMAKNVGSIIANLQLYRAVLHEREELMQTFESLTSGLLLISPEGKVTQMNSAARDVLGAPQDVLGRWFREVVKLEDLLDFMSSGMSGKDTPPFEMTMDLNGMERTYAVQGSQVRGEDGKSLGFVTIFNDVTNQKNLDKMKSSFVAMASHELRTPLTAIKGFSSTLLEAVDEGIYGAEDQKEFLGIIVSECDRLRRLIDDLLNTARIESGQSLKPNYERFELVPLLEKVQRVQSQASHKHKVELEIHDQMPQSIIGDEDKFDQILTNLLNNAIKYSEGGTITIHAWDAGENIKIGIQDQGIGIPSDQVEKVFERFHRVNNDDNRKIYGTGLGLFLVKHLVEQIHLGHIWAESELGVGSTFYFEVPKELDTERALALNED